MDAPTPPRRSLVLLRAAASLGLLLTLALTWQALTRTTVAGCGAGSVCETVLSTVWSRVLGVPVAACAMAVYIVVLAASFRLRSPAGRGMLGLSGVVLIAAAAWFGLVQAVIIDAFCPLCMAAHAVGLVTGGIATRLARSRFPTLLAGVAAVAVLAAVQAVQPRPATSDRQAIGFSDTGPGPDRAIRFSLDTVGAQMSVGQTPLIGDPDAPAVLIEFFDYTCAFCRGMHGYLQTVQETFGDQVALAVVPVPLGGACNPTLKGEIGHAGSCELSRLALAVWRADPEAFAQFHAAIFHNGPDPAEAQALAEQLVGKEALATALADPEIDAQLARNSELFDRLGGSLPQVIIGRVHIRGLPPSPDVLLDDVAEQFDLTPVQSPAATE